MGITRFAQSGKLATALIAGGGGSLFFALAAELAADVTVAAGATGTVLTATVNQEIPPFVLLDASYNVAAEANAAGVCAQDWVLEVSTNGGGAFTPIVPRQNAQTELATVTLHSNVSARTLVSLGNTSALASGQLQLRLRLTATAVQQDVLAATGDGSAVIAVGIYA